MLDLMPPWGSRNTTRLLDQPLAPYVMDAMSGLGSRDRPDVRGLPKGGGIPG